MASREGAKLDADPEKTAAPTEASSYLSDVEATDEKPTPHNPRDDPDRDEAEWMDRGHMHDLESQKSHVRAFQLSKRRLPLTDLDPINQSRSTTRQRHNRTNTHLRQHQIASFPNNDHPNQSPAKRETRARTPTHLRSRRGPYRLGSARRPRNAAQLPAEQEMAAPRSDICHYLHLSTRVFDVCPGRLVYGQGFS